MEANSQSYNVFNSQLYKALGKRLNEVDSELRKIQSDDIMFEKLSFGSRSLRYGDSHANVPLLRAKLISYLPIESFDFDPYLYDENLVEAVKSYQRDKGLKDDGIIGVTTLAVMNRTLLDEKKQIIVNLYRLRQPEWLGREPLRIEVDIARYMMTAYENDKPIFTMPAVVGRPERETNRFQTTMTGVRLNPGWTMPPTIKAKDYIPKLRENPEWVTEQGVLIYTNWERDATPVDPKSIDWNILTDSEIKAMRFFKMAGDDNPLGRYRFLMDNQYDIYLHDTNQKYLFDRANRAYSSGCVRINDPRKLTEFLLVDNPDWTPEKLDRILEKGKTFDIRANRSIPVYFDYKTAWLDGDEKLVLGHDIYGLDLPLYDVIIAATQSEIQSDEKIKLEQ